MLKINFSNHDALLRQYRKKLMLDVESVPDKVKYTIEDIKKIIPHREPILLLDSINTIDINSSLIIGKKYISPDDPIFQGHFPDYPVYPGTFQVEMIGQLGICLQFFTHHNTDIISPDAKPLKILATRIRGANFVEQIKPGTDVTLIIQKLRQKKRFSTFIGQALVDNKIACVLIGEVVLLDENYEIVNKKKQKLKQILDSQNPDA